MKKSETDAKFESDQHKSGTTIAQLLYYFVIFMITNARTAYLQNSEGFNF